MKLKIAFISILLLFGSLIIQDRPNNLPEGFVYVDSIIPDLNIDLKYYSVHNFVGDTIDGYNDNSLILTEPTAIALSKVQDELQQQNLCLLVFDGYRPQRAVNHFVRWAKNLNDTINKQYFYPDVEKRHLFREEYIATRSGHSRGSTVDLTIIDANTEAPLDMGTDFDFFGKESWINHPDLTETQKQNRQLLQAIMLKYNFRNYPKEWWHFTLRQEPFPKTFFDFVIE